METRFMPMLQSSRCISQTIFYLTQIDVPPPPHQIPNPPLVINDCSLRGGLFFVVVKGVKVFQGVGGCRGAGIHTYIHILWKC